MKVTNCTQNTLPKQSFGMKIKFNPEDVKKGIIPCVETMIDALTRTNATKEIIGLAPNEVRLCYKGAKLDYSDSLFGMGATIDHCWNMKFGDFRPKEVRIKDGSPSQRIYTRLVREALDFADSIVKQQAQRVQEAARVQADAKKIENAGLV